MTPHPLHPAAWVIETISDSGWIVIDLLAFTRASTLLTAHRPGHPPVVVKAGFGSNHVLAELDPADRPAAYGFYWYAQMTEAERALTRDDFRHESDLTAAATNIAHVVPALERGTTARFDWYTMPLCNGGNFRTFMSGQQPVAAGLHILADVGEGLDGLHRNGIVHRDVYQENILIHNRRGLITDLGAARRLDTPRGPRQRGPEVHWPPEYARAYDEAGPAADVFSLAVLTHRHLCADIPHLDRHPTLNLVPSELKTALIAALSAEAADRPAIDELTAAIRRAAHIIERQPD